MVDLATAVNDRTIRLDFHWVEQAKPAFVNYATEDWTKLTDQIEVFRLLKYLNETFLQYQSFPNDKDAIKILTVQYSIMALGFRVMCQEQYIERRSENISTGTFFYTVQRVR